MERIWGSWIKNLLLYCTRKNEYSPSSDIDVLIVSDNLPEDYEERIRIKTEIKSKIDSFSPFQIHLATNSEQTLYSFLNFSPVIFSV